MKANSTKSRSHQERNRTRKATGARILGTRKHGDWFVRLEVQGSPLTQRAPCDVKTEADAQRYGAYLVRRWDRTNPGERWVPSIPDEEVQGVVAYIASAGTTLLAAAEKVFTADQRMAI